MGIPLGPLRETLAAARKISPAWAKATKKTMRVLHNEGQADSLSGMLKGKFDWNAEATFDDMMYPSRKTSAGYAKDGYSAASMAKLPKGTVTNRAGTGAMRARVKKLAQTQETAAKSIPPFKGGTRFTGGDPRAMVTGAARREELSMKSKVAGKRSKAKKPVKSRVMGPDTQEQSKVDDLFGVKW